MQPNGFDVQDIIGESPEFQSVLRAARVVAVTDATALVLGETGTGKELLARLIHHESRRASGPWMAVNCAALPRDLVEAELFGYRRGAFTGAQTDRPGRIRQAQGGTLFLDEVAELPLSAQAKLLRFLEEGECQALGSDTPEPVDVRVLAATHRDLRHWVETGRFREDLYYRLHVIPLELPPLRERPGDIGVLLDALTEKLAVRHGVTPPRFSTQARRLLALHPWPGNVRELRNLCERCVVLYSGQTVDPEHLQLEVRSDALLGDLPDWQLPRDGVRLDRLEAGLIRQALGRTQGNRTRAARLLGLTRDTLLYRIKKYALEGE